MPVLPIPLEPNRSGAAATVRKSSRVSQQLLWPRAITTGRKERAVDTVASRQRRQRLIELSGPHMSSISSSRSHSDSFRSSCSTRAPWSAHPGRHVMRAGRPETRGLRASGVHPPFHWQAPIVVLRAAPSLLPARARARERRGKSAAAGGAPVGRPAHLGPHDRQDSGKHLTAIGRYGVRAGSTGCRSGQWPRRRLGGCRVRPPMRSLLVHILVIGSMLRPGHVGTNRAQRR